MSLSQWKEFWVDFFQFNFFSPPQIKEQPQGGWKHPWGGGLMWGRGTMGLCWGVVGSQSASMPQFPPRVPLGAVSPAKRHRDEQLPCGGAGIWGFTSFERSRCHLLPFSWRKREKPPRWRVLLVTPQPFRGVQLEEILPRTCL